MYLFLLIMLQHPPSPHAKPHIFQLKHFLLMLEKSFVPWGFTAAHHQTNTSLQWQCQKWHRNSGKDSSHFPFPKQMVTKPKQSEDCFQPRASFHYCSVRLYIYMFVTSYHLCLFRIPSPLSPLSLIHNQWLTNSSNNSSAFSWVSLTEFKEIDHFVSLQHKQCCFPLFVAACLDEKPAPFIQWFFDPQSAGNFIKLPETTGKESLKSYWWIQAVFKWYLI